MEHRNLCFQSQRRQSVKEETASTKDAREYDKVYSRAVRSGNAEEVTRDKPTAQLQLSAVSAILFGAKIPKGPKPEQSIDTDVDKGFIKTLDESKVKGTFEKKW